MYICMRFYHSVNMAWCFGNNMVFFAVDGGTAWMARDSMIEADVVDTSNAEAPWVDLAQQLKQDLTSIILMSEDDLQVQCQHLSVFSVNHIPPCIVRKQ